jgi:hypothetical protein
MGELEHLVQARRRVPTEDPHEDEQEAHRLRLAYRNAMQLGDAVTAETAVLWSEHLFAYSTAAK